MLKVVNRNFLLYKSRKRKTVAWGCSLDLRSPVMSLFSVTKCGVLWVCMNPSEASIGKWMVVSYFSILFMEISPSSIFYWLWIFLIAEYLKCSGLFELVFNNLGKRKRRIRLYWIVFQALSWKVRSDRILIR